MFFAGCESAAGRNGLRPLIRITDSFTEFPEMLTPFRDEYENGVQREDISNFI